MSTAVLGRHKAAANRPRRRWRRRLLVAALLAAYPLAVLAYVYWHSLTSGLPGPRHGPQDAYRHVLASAVVAYTTSPRVVHWVTAVMEFADHPSSHMDRHNNMIGAAIGAGAASFSELRQQSLARVRAGQVDASDPGRVTWLEPRHWRQWPI
jgi:hypothetical protein